MTEKSKDFKPIGYLPFAFLCVLACWTFFQGENLVEQYMQGKLSVQVDGGRKFVSDFVHFYVAGTIAGSPERYQIYDWEVQRKVFQQLVGFDVTKSEFYTQYMPQVFTMMVPIALIPLNTAHLIWDAATLIFGSLGLFFFARNAGENSEKVAPVILLIAMSCYPAWQTLINGQLSWLLLGFFSCYFICVLKGRPILAGMFLALCAIKPQYVLFALLPLIFARHYRVLLSTAIFVALVLGAAVANVGVDSFLSYPATLHEVEETVKSVAPEAMPCMRGLLNIFLNQKTALSISSALSLAALILLAIVFRKNSGTFSTQRGFLAASAVSVMTSLFFSAHTHAYDCLLIALSAVLFLAASNAKSPFHRPIIGLLVAYPILSWFLFLCGAFTASQIGMQLLAILNNILLVLLFAWFLQMGEEKASAAPSIQ